MKQIILITLMILPFAGVLAQDSTSVDTPPKKILELKVGKIARFDTLTIRFLEIKDDSRCPSDVTCFWPGEVIAVLGFYKGDSILEKKEFTFGVKAINPDNPKEILVLDGQTVYGYNISPYPISTRRIKPTEYTLELLIK